MIIWADPQTMPFPLGDFIIFCDKRSNTCVFVYNFKCGICPGLFCVAERFQIIDFSLGFASTWTTATLIQSKSQMIRTKTSPMCISVHGKTRLWQHDFIDSLHPIHSVSDYYPTYPSHFFTTSAISGLLTGSTSMNVWAPLHPPSTTHNIHLMAAWEPPHFEKRAATITWWKSAGGGDSCLEVRQSISQCVRDGTGWPHEVTDRFHRAAVLRVVKRQKTWTPVSMNRVAFPLVMLTWNNGPSISWVNEGAVGQLIGVSPHPMSRPFAMKGTTPNGNTRA